MLAPFFYLFWGHYHFPIWAYVAGGALLAASLGVIWRWGSGADKRLALWGLTCNALPFLLVSLTRYQRSVNQAFVARYGIFTLLGAFLILGTAWRLWQARVSRKSLSYSLVLLLVGLIICGQAFSLPRWRAKYAEMSRASRQCYEALLSAGSSETLHPEEFAKFCPTAHPVITPSQALAIRHFLRGPAPGP